MARFSITFTRLFPLPLLFCLLIISSLSRSAFSQGWTTQNSGTNNHLYGVDFVDANNGWVVGVSELLHTTNGGTTWLNQTAGTGAILRSVSFTDVNTGWIVGDSGIVLHTTNGGLNWSRQISGTLLWLGKVVFIDANTGWAVGRTGTIIRTTNGGSTWTNQVYGGNDLGGVTFPTASAGWIVSDVGNISHTDNGGSSWNVQYSATNHLQSSFFIDVNNGWACGLNGTILHTTNSGANWNIQNSGTINTIHSLSFSDVNNGWAVCDSGMIIHTTNGGTTWSSQSSSTTNYLSDVVFTNVNSGWAVGVNGTILHYTPITLTHPNGGETSIVGVSDTVRWTQSGLTGNVTIALNTTYPSTNWTTLGTVAASQGYFVWTPQTTQQSITARFRVTSVSNPAIGDTSNANFRIYTAGGNNTSSLSFNGTSDYIEISNPNLPIGSASRTAEAWFKLDTLQTHLEYEILNWGLSQQHRLWGISVAPNNTLSLWQYTNNLTTTFQLTSNQWHHAAATYDGSLISLYADGQLVGSMNYALNTGSSNLRIGIDPIDFMDQGFGEYMNGKIDEIRIWNTARTQAQIQSTMYSNLTGTEIGLVSYWRFNEGVGTIVFNDVPNGASGTIYGATRSTDIPPISTSNITRPNGGDFFRIGTNDTIRWTNFGLTGNVRIELNRNYPTGTWDSITTVLASSSSYLWNVARPSTSSARFRISSVTDTTKSDISDSYFTIGYTPPTIINFTHAGQYNDHFYYYNNSNPDWQTARIMCEQAYGHLATITSADEDSAVFRMLPTATDYFIGLTDSLDEGVFQWVTGEPFNYSHWSSGEPDNLNDSRTIPNADYVQYDMTTPHCWRDQTIGTHSWVLLEIEPFTVIHPNGSETFVIGVPDSIKWNSSGLTGNVTIKLNRNYPTGAWTTLISTIPVTQGYFNWTPTPTPTSNARIAIIPQSDTTKADTSNWNFSIQFRNISITHENGGEVIPLNAPDTIRWNSNYATNISISLSPDGQAYDSLLTITNSLDISAGNGSFVWTPTGNGTSRARLWIYDNTNSIEYWSASNFTIVSPTFFVRGSPVNFPGTKPHKTDSLFVSIKQPQLQPFNYLTMTGASSGVFTRRVVDTDSNTVAGDSLKIWIRFTPDSTVNYYDTLRVTFQAPYNPVTIPISGLGVGTYIFPTVTTLTFPNQIEPTRRDSLTLVLNVQGNRNLLSGTWVTIRDSLPFSSPALTNVPVGQNDTIKIYFNPLAQGSYSGQIGLVSNAINGDTIKITVSGVSHYVPAPPGNLRVTTLGENANLVWNRVDTSLGGVPLTVQRYLVYFRNSNSIPWQFLAYTTGANSTTYSHSGVVTYSPAMYYQVTAWVGAGSSDSFDRVVRNIPVGTAKEEVIRKLMEVDGVQSRPVEWRTGSK